MILSHETHTNRPHTRHTGYFLGCVLLVTFCSSWIMVNHIFIRSVVQLQKLQNGSQGPQNSFPVKIYGYAQNERASNRMKLILLWSSLFSGLEFLKNSFNHSSCSEKKCEITSDRRRLMESDAVMFHLRTVSMTDIPRSRSSRQKWIFFSLEAPPYSHFHGFAFMKDMFNWTMTYRSDSDIVLPYGRVIRKDRSTFRLDNLRLLWKQKRKMATWMVSHCDTDSNREDYIKEMEKFMEVATFGECGVAVCPVNKTEECLNNFSKKFFFYLAFENAICDDYVTEKFFRALKYNMIPVVFGGGKYSKISPPSSYIDAMEFSSPKQLSIYLYKVAENFTLYSQYFKWKLNGYGIHDVPDPCMLCEKLHSNSFHLYSVYPDIQKWWVAESHCRQWENNPTA
ncbi:alpha-(1,3)-fucosyltransferase C [Trichonephila inaurata madagascariensis]|uniref:Fucosyltransferase n=1 Tax=Trichonephila inaurata madagascariensis TaxID=2747483 RepID=A0A8X6Y3C3_9ARAC|nr:alpha-(1,3)-fucosyltransferase C [Trichonephila inaurata madagascariensis]